MTYNEFSDLLGGGWYDVVNVQCQMNDCKNIENRQKGTALKNFSRNKGIFKCRKCAYTEEGRKKISKATSYKRSDKTKKQMSESATKKWDTDWGKKQKRKLSRLTAIQHTKTNLDKSKRRVLYISAKNNGAIRACNSSGEFVACEDFFEKDPLLLSYESQVFYELEDRSRNLDFLLHYADYTKAIEVKPAKRMTEAENILQIQDSEANAIKNGWKFELWTEKELGITRWKEATRRADEYRLQHHLIDYGAYRKERDKAKGKKHYNNKIAKDRIIVFCQFCNDYHSRLKKTYDENVKKNGRFICIHENGVNTGKKPKEHLKKKNEYEDIGKKQCTGKGGCMRILPIDNFSKGKSVCKECRAKHYKDRHHEKKG